MSKDIIIPACLFLLASAIYSCNNNGSKDKIVKKDSSPVNVPVVTPINDDMPKSPIINIEDTLVVKSIFLCVKDSAANEAGVGKKFSRIFDSTLGKIINTNKLTVKGYPAAWFTKNEAPYFFEVGLPVDKAPSKLPKNVFIKITGGDSAIVAHFFGPYEMTKLGYEAVLERLKEEKPKKKPGKAYEVYVDDPVDEKGNPKNPFTVQTDIILPYN